MNSLKTSIKNVLSAKYNLFQISQSRDVLFGISTIIIMLFHSVRLLNASSVDIVNKVMKIPLTYGNIGVDIFLFLSGVGLYFSFSKDSDIKKFYFKRGIRILPALLLVAIAYSFGMLMLKKISVLTALTNILMVSFVITGKRTFWFFSLLLVLYYLYPLIYKLLVKFHFYGFLIFLALTAAFSVLLFFVSRERFNMYEIALMRIPSFLIGAWMGPYIKEKRELPLLPTLFFSGAVCCLVIVVLLRWNDWLNANYYMHRVLFCPFVIGLILIISAKTPKKKGKLISALIWIGSLSCEVYLLFERLDSVFNLLVSSYLPNSNYYFAYYLFLSLICIGAAWTLSKICGVVQKRLYAMVKE